MSSSTQVARRPVTSPPPRERLAPPAADASVTAPRAPSPPAAPELTVPAPEEHRDDRSSAIPAIAPATPEDRSSADQAVSLVPTEANPRSPTILDPAPLAVPPEWQHRRTAEAPPPGPRMTPHTVAPVPRVMGRRPRVRKVTRVVRHVDPWTVFKVAGVFSLVVYVVALTAGVLLWNVAYATGTIDNLERFFESFGWSEFEFNGGEIYHNAWIAGLFGAVGLTGAAVLAASLLNLITDLVGGVRFTVLEEEVVERTTAPMRRFVVRRPTGEHHLGTDLDVARTPGPPDAASR